MIINLQYQQINMSTTKIILIVLLILFAGFSYYQKYSKKNVDKTNAEQQKDDYEPYSGK